MNPQRGQRQTACMRYISAPHRSHSILSWPGAATFTSFALTEAEAGGRTGGSDIRADYVMDRRAARRARHSRDARSPTRCGACHAMPSRGAISCASRTMIARSRSEKGRIIVGDGSVGYARGAPCDGIVVGAGGAPRVSISLRDQLADGGRIVIPLGTFDHQKSSWSYAPPNQFDGSQRESLVRLMRNKARPCKCRDGAEIVLSSCIIY